MEGFGYRLINARKEKGLSQKAFAELLEISPTRLNYWEKDKREPDLLMFSKIVEVLEADADELLGLKIIERSQAEMQYRKLNPIGKAKADEYITDLSYNPKYTALDGDNRGDIASDIISELKQLTAHQRTPTNKK